MKHLLLFALVLLAFALPAMADPQCGPGEVAILDGGFWCGWIWPTNEFDCFATWYCQSACYPYECADLGASLKASPVSGYSPLRVRLVPAKTLALAPAKSNPPYPDCWPCMTQLTPKRSGL
jgi:hypothetical protein